MVCGRAASIWSSHSSHGDEIFLQRTKTVNTVIIVWIRHVTKVFVCSNEIHTVSNTMHELLNTFITFRRMRSKDGMNNKQNWWRENYLASIVLLSKRLDVVHPELLQCVMLS